MSRLYEWINDDKFDGMYDEIEKNANSEFWKTMMKTKTYLYRGSKRKNQYI